MKTSMDSWLRTKSDYLHLGAEEIALCDFGDKLYGEIKTSIVWGIVRSY